MSSNENSKDRAIDRLIKYFENPENLNEKDIDNIKGGIRFLEEKEFVDMLTEEKVFNEEGKIDIQVLREKAGLIKKELESLNQQNQENEIKKKIERGIKEVIEIVNQHKQENEIKQKIEQGNEMKSSGQEQGNEMTSSGQKQGNKKVKLKLEKLTGAMKKFIQTPKGKMLSMLVAASLVGTIAVKQGLEKVGEKTNYTSIEQLEEVKDCKRSDIEDLKELADEYKKFESDLDENVKIGENEFTRFLEKLEETEMSIIKNKLLGAFENGEVDISEIKIIGDRYINVDGTMYFANGEMEDTINELVALQKTQDNLNEFSKREILKAVERNMKSLVGVLDKTYKSKVNFMGEGEFLEEKEKQVDDGVELGE